MLKLRFKDNKDKKDSSFSAVWLVEPKVSIGSASGNDLILDDPKVAAQHAEILVKHEKLTLVNRAGRDLRVNGKAVAESCPLATGDQLSIGDSLLEVTDPKLEQRPAPASSRSEETGWALKANHPALANRVYNLKSETVIGRSNECDITLAAAHLSRRHVKLVVEKGLLYVRDLGSANGTYLNGQRVTEARVRRGDELRFDTLSFGVLGPASEDLDKTSIRPMQAVQVPKPETSTAASTARPTRVQRPAGGKTNQAAKAPASSEAAPASDQAAGKSRVLWAVALLLGIAAAAGIAWQQGMLG